VDEAGRMKQPKINGSSDKTRVEAELTLSLELKRADVEEQD
jgi:hypothetical protein